jgi:hypothetical protein
MSEVEEPIATSSAGLMDTEVGTAVVVEEQVSGVDVCIAMVASTVGGPILGTLTLTRQVINRMVNLTDPLVDVLVLHPQSVPPSVQPGNVLLRLSRRGHRERAALRCQLDMFLDAMVPRVTDEMVRRLDLDALMTRIDVARLAQQVVAEVDLPEIIRESTIAVSSEAVRDVRMRGISGDDTVGRAVDRLLLRHRQATAATAAEAPAVSVDPAGGAARERPTDAPR